MTVKDFANVDVKACNPDKDLASAAQIMWEGDCGAVPVINEERKVVGMLTDRDICIAAATRASRPSDILVRDVMSRDIAACAPGDDVNSALKTMKERRVRRLPVLDGQGRLAGILSITDLVRRSSCRSDADVPGQALLDTLKAVCAHSRQAVSA